jgi:hypothetical protein
MQRFASDSVLSHVVRAAIVASVFGAFLIHDLFGWSSFRAALAVATATSFFVVFLTSHKLETWLQLRQLRGYWKYTPAAQYGVFPPPHTHGLDRVVQIDLGDEGIRIRGWWQGDGDTTRWQETNVLLTRPGRLKGYLVYWYESVDGEPGEGFDGVTSLSWTRGHMGERVCRMSGWYIGGRATSRNGDIGTIVFDRIRETAFNEIRFRTRPPAAADEDGEIRDRASLS